MTDRVELLLRGRMLERFITRAAEQGIYISEICRIGAQEMRLTACEKDARTLLSLAEEYRMDMTVVGTAGWAHWRRRFYERITLILGLILGAVLIVLFTSRIWRIEAVSVDGMADAVLLEQLEQSAVEWGVRIGEGRNSLDRDALSMFLQAQYPSLTYVSVRLSGVKLVIEAAIENEAPEVYDLSASRDLVAARDAVVVYVEPLTGQVNVKAGDTVKAGQVLIRGQELIDTGVMHDVRALGTVIGRVWFSGECRLPMQQTILERTGRLNSSSELRLYDWSFRLSQGQDYSCQQTETEYLPIGGMYLPLMIVRQTRWEAQERSVPFDLAVLRAQGEVHALQQARAQLPEDARETDYWAEYTQQDGILTVHVTIEAQMNIAVGHDAL